MQKKTHWSATINTKCCLQISRLLIARRQNLVDSILLFHHDVLINSWYFKKSASVCSVVNFLLPYLHMYVVQLTLDL